MANRRREYWWHGNPVERFWCEITARNDIGADLRCPQADDSGKPYWSYSLINEIQPGDVVYHYDTTRRAFVGASLAKGAAVADTMTWAPHGTAGRSKKQAQPRAAWRLKIGDFIGATPPLTLADIEKDQKWVRDWLSAREVHGPVCAPFQPYPKRLRAFQGYLTKMPVDFVERWSALRVMASNLGTDTGLLRLTGIFEQEKEDAYAILASEIQQHAKGQGFQVSPALRKAIETYAVETAQKHYEALGYTVKTVGKPYDLHCTRADKTVFVEVKGTTTKGLEIILTPNEVAFARDHREQMALFVVSKIEASTEDGKPTAIGGESSWIEPWDIDTGCLEPMSFQYQVPQRRLVITSTLKTATNGKEIELPGIPTKGLEKTKSDSCHLPPPTRKT